ncbi:MAG: hypothetical protein ABSA53_23925 [Streptosporangiaceae bacterium]|jgi:hypothetical protein
MAVQTREQGRCLGGRPPYGYRLADAGPHPNKARARRGRQLHRDGHRPGAVGRNPDGSCSFTQVPRYEVDKFAESGTLSF